MGGFKENIVGFGVTIQPTPGTFNEPSDADLVAISAPDNGSDPISADDPTLTGSIFAAPSQFLGRRGRAGATMALRGPGGAAPFAAGEWVPGRILQAAGFSEVINDTAITGTAAAGGTTQKIVMEASSSAVDDFYKGMPIQHAGIGAGAIQGASLIRGYDGTTKTATLMETVMAAIVAGNYTIPPSVTYLLSTGVSIPLLSCKVWRHKKAYMYRDCAINSFTINIPVANDQNTDLPSIDFAMVGVPVQSVDEAAPALPSSLLTPIPPARAGKFTFNGIKIGHQTMSLEFSLDTGAPPNQNFDAGQEGYEIMSGTRTVNLDLNEQLVATLDIDALTDSQALVPIQSGWGQAAGNRFLIGVPNTYIGAMSPAARNGFLGLTGTAAPTDVDRSIALSLIW